MLLTLLPFSAWAENYDVTVTLGTINKVFGQVDPPLSTSDFSITQDAGGTITKDDLLPKFTFKRVDASIQDAVGASIYYTVLVTNPVAKGDDKYNVVIANNGFINVLPKQINDGSINATIDNQSSIKYNGAAWTTGVQFTVTDGETPLVSGRDYELVADPYGTNTAAGVGAGTITIKGKGNYDPTSEKTITFDIAAGEFASVNFNPAPSFTYNAAAQTPGYAVKVGNNVDALPTDYDVEYFTDAERTEDIEAANIKNAGIYYVKVIGKNNLEGAVDANLYFEIAKRPIANANGTLAENFTTSDIAGLVFTGEALTPASTLSYKGVALTVTTDYTLSHANNTNATTETSKATITYTAAENSNFSGSFTKEFEIAKANIATVDIAAIADQSYNGGNAVVPVPAVKLGTVDIDNSNFVIAYTNNTARGEATVTLTPAANGNFTGVNKTANFNIVKATLKVRPVAASKQRGTLDPALTYEYVEGFGFLGSTDSEALFGATKPTVTRSNGEAVGEYAMTVAYAGAELDNYNVECVNDDPVVKFTITAVNVAIVATPDPEEYGYKLPALDKEAFKYTDAGIIDHAHLTGLTFTVKGEDEHVYAAGDLLPVGTYTVTPSAATSTPADYVFTYTAGTLTVGPKVIKLAAQPQNVAYSATPAAVLNDLSDTYVKITNSEDEAYTYTTFNTAFGTTFADEAAFKANFISALTWTGDKTLASPGQIEVTQANNDLDATNFTITPVPANVTFTGAATTITLARTDAKAEDLIKEYNGVANMTVKFEARKLKKEQWYALVLPFQTSVSELSKKLGYAVVNIIKNENTNPSKMQFKLHMGDIEANQPFLVKVYNADNATDQSKDLADVMFTEKTITYSAEPKDFDEAGNELIGLYKTTTLKADDNLWIINGGTFNKVKADATLRPIVAYLKTATVLDGFAPAIYVEDIDGSVTAINSINADGVAVPAEGWYTINGVKLQGAPTQKGIYIQNGKKVILK